LAKQNKILQEASLEGPLYDLNMSSRLDEKHGQFLFLID